MKLRRLVVTFCLAGAALSVAAPANAWECNDNKCEEVTEQVWLIVCGLEPGACM